MRLLVFLFFLISIRAQAFSKECEDWFAKSKIKASSPTCELDCAGTIKTGFDTFRCPEQCDELCHPPDPCRPTSEEFLAKAFADKRPAAWPNAKESFKAWTPKEKSEILEALKKVPRAIWPSSPPQLLRFNAAKDLGNPASGIEQLNEIAIYDLALSPSLICKEF